MGMRPPEIGLQNGDDAAHTRSQDNRMHDLAHAERRVSSFETFGQPQIQDDVENAIDTNQRRRQLTLDDVHLV
ncbi:MAG TPA: hypothetical protein VIL94_06280, partial [Acidothermaceae bacterium]